MKPCTICRNNDWLWEVHYTQPDKYEKWIGLTDIERDWFKCKHCGHYEQDRNYSLSKLDNLYTNGYRSKSLRRESIQETFDRIMLNPTEAMEREDTLFLWAHDIKNMLDIGSGLGVWPSLVDEYTDFDITCVEPNKDSCDFIRSKGFECHRTLDDIDKNYDLATVIHVLEHIQDIDGFIRSIPCERIFIEVPDSFEFEFLPEDHDEFNSCHVHFFNTAGLFLVLERNGFFPVEARRVKYDDRNLLRIMVYAVKE